MKTAAECLARAAELDALSALPETHLGREEYANLALHWRKAALLARQQEAWALLHRDA